MTVALGTVLEETVGSGDATGVVAVALHDGEVTFLGAAGARDREAGAPMTTDTIFLIASMTKAVTSVAAMQLVERGVLTLDGPIAEVLPALDAAPVLAGYAADASARLRPASRPITLRHLLTHTSGLAYTTWNARLYEYRQRFPDARPIAGRDVRTSAPLVRDPGECWEYSNSTDWLGFAVEAATGMRLGEYFERHVFAPLGMRDTGFDLPAHKRARAAARYLRAADGTLAREPDGPPQPRAFDSGGGGLLSTAPDYARFLGGLLDPDGPLLAPATLALMGENQIGDGVAGRMPTSEPWRSCPVALLPGMRPGWGLGFLINPQPVPGGRAAGSLAWGGIYNTYYWLDPSARVAGAVFTQVLPFADPRVLARFDAFERCVYAA